MNNLIPRFAATLLAATLFFSAPAGSQTPSGKDVVAPEAYASHDPVARGMSFQVAVVLKIRSGFHVNAREVTEDYLIPTDLRAEIPAGFNSAQSPIQRARSKPSPSPKTKN